MPSQARSAARSFLQYDVFTGEPLLGNQLAVFTDARGLDGSMMQRIAREMNFPESTFILPVEWAGTDIRMRIFTPAVEMPMAGHPTIGSTFALAEIGVITPETRRFIFHLNAGPTPVELEWADNRLAFAWMTQPNPVFGRIVDDRAAVAATIGLTPEDLLPDIPVQEVSCAVPFLYVPLRDPEIVDRAISDAGAFKRLAAATGVDLPVFLFALDRVDAHGADLVRSATVGLASLSPRATGSSLAGSASADPPVSIYSRMFAPEFGIIEDPATGIASGALGCYLVRYGLITPAAARSIVSHQGVAMGRASQIHISISVTGDAHVREGSAGPVIISDVKVGGEAVLVARGELLL
jgi:trans-2,3-dihydro-3-hydroxyanthranilate isomerase